MLSVSMECASSPLAATSPSAQLTNEQLQLPALCVSVSPCVLPLRVIRNTSCVTPPCHTQQLCVFPLSVSFPGPFVLNTQHVSFSIIFRHFAIFRSCLFHWLCSVSFESQVQERCSLTICAVHRSCVSYTGAPLCQTKPNSSVFAPPTSSLLGTSSLGWCCQITYCCRCCLGLINTI